LVGVYLRPFSSKEAIFSFFFVFILSLSLSLLRLCWLLLGRRRWAGYVLSYLRSLHETRCKRRRSSVQDGAEGGREL